MCFIGEDLCGIQLAAVLRTKQVPQASSCLKEMLHVGWVEWLLALWRLADCSCPWAGHSSLYQYRDIVIISA